MPQYDLSVQLGCRRKILNLGIRAVDLLPQGLAHVLQDQPMHSDRNTFSKQTFQKFSNEYCMFLYMRVCIHAQNTYIQTLIFS